MKTYTKNAIKFIITLWIGLTSFYAEAKPIVYISGSNAIDVLDPTPLRPIWITKVNLDNFSPAQMSVSPDHRNVYVITKEKIIAIIDTLTSTQLGSIELRKDFTDYIRQSAISPDGKTLYVIGLNNDTALLATIDIASRKITHKLILPNFKPAVMAIPEALGITPDGKKALVLLRSKPSSSAVAFIDLEKQSVSQISTLPGSGHRLVITPDGKKAYIPVHDSNYSPPFGTDNELYDLGDSISLLLVFDLSTNELKTKLPLKGGTDITLSSDGRKAYMPAIGKINIIDTVSDTVTDNIPILQGGYYRVAVNPDGTKCYVTDRNFASVMIIDLKTRETIDFGSSAKLAEVIFLDVESVKSVGSPLK